MLGLEKKWKTQRWQTRVLHSTFVGMTTLDAFLMTQALLPDRGLEDADGSMDAFVTKLVAQMLPPDHRHPSSDPLLVPRDLLLLLPLLRWVHPPNPMSLKGICARSPGSDMPLFSRVPKPEKNDL